MALSINHTRTFVSQFLGRHAVVVGLASVAPSLLAGAAFAGELRIVGGNTESRWPAVGALLSEGEWFCSGTVIAPRVVMTAAHCLEGMNAADLELFIGADANHPDQGRRIRVESAHVHPNYATSDDHDVGIMVLSEDAGVTPVPARLAPLTDAVIGKSATFVGYGLVVQDGEGGQKRSVEIPISELNDFFIGYATPNRNTCNGDSGGPALMDLGNGLEVIGVTSWGDAGCSEYGYNTRSDVFADWIGAFVEGRIPDASEVPPVTGGDVTVDDGETGDVGGGDLCEEMGWYNDDYCDEDCARPDPDCRDGGTTVEGDGGDAGWDDAGDVGADGGGSDGGGSDDADADGSGDVDVTAPGGLGCSAGAGGMWMLLGGLGLVLARLSMRSTRRA